VKMMNEIHWEPVVDDIGPRLYRYFCARFSPEQADDLSQECLLRLVRKAKDGGFDPQKGSLRMLAFGIAHFLVLETARAPRFEKLEAEELANQSEDTLETKYIEKEQACQLRNAIRQLTPIEQEVITLVLDQALTLTDIGAILNTAEGTVKSHVHRAKKKLFEILSGERGQA
jgi:RNA polymerase sigma factor (sigma-70 family)